jgi:predicted AlkP superfamily pyrophosphatase or phosphodiesterase
LRAIILLICALGSLSCATPTLMDRAPETRASRQAAIRGEGPPRRVVLITIAGLESSDFLNVWGHIARDGDLVRMPNLARLASEGAIAINANPPSPSSVYASHATLATGRLPTKHGIIADRALDEAGKRSLPFWDNRLLKGTALWDAAIGRGVLSLGWPTTTGARIELIVPDGGPTDASTAWLDYMRNLSSPILMRDLEAIAAQAMEAEEKLIGDDRDPITWPTPVERDAAFIEVACRVAASERDPGLWLIRLNQTEIFQRSVGYGSVAVDEALARVDVGIGRLSTCLHEAGKLADTAILVTGDVAYGAVHTRIEPNVTLVNAGLIGRDPRSSTGVRSWLALSRSNGRSAYVYARGAEAALKARKLLEEEAAKTGAFDVVSAVDLAEAGADPQAWFGLAAKPGFIIGDGLTRPLLRPAKQRASAGAFPFRDIEASSVGLVAWGRGIRSQVRVPSLELVDVAPTIAALLGLRLDEPLDGEQLLGILRAARPLPPPGPKRIGIDSDGDADRALRELGGGRELGRDQ